MNFPRCAPLLFLALAAVSLSDAASACKVYPHHPADYLERRVADAVVFRGTVSRVQETALSSSGMRSQDIEFQVTRWWRGAQSNTVLVRGTTGSMKGTDCEGTFDFSAQPQEEWLIFGQQREGRIIPDKFVSLKVVNGSIPERVSKALDKAQEAPAGGTSASAPRR